jgi:hypothetical protein
VTQGQCFQRVPLLVKGSICAQGNRGSFAGFLFSGADSQVTFHQPDTARINDNTPTDINIDCGNVFCGSSKTSWAPGEYIITGRVCACDDDFQQQPPPGTTNRTCNSCLAPWDPATCSCKVSSSCWPHGVRCLWHNVLLSQ